MNPFFALRHSTRGKGTGGSFKTHTCSQNVMPGRTANVAALLHLLIAPVVIFRPLTSGKTTAPFVSTCSFRPTGNSKIFFIQVAEAASRRLFFTSAGSSTIAATQLLAAYQSTSCAESGNSFTTKRRREPQQHTCFLLGEDKAPPREHNHFNKGARRD